MSKILSKSCFLLIVHICKIENDDCNVAGGGVCVSPKGVVQCEGIPRKSWMTKCVAL